MRLCHIPGLPINPYPQPPCLGHLALWLTAQHTEKKRCSCPHSLLSTRQMPPCTVELTNAHHSHTCLHTQHRGLEEFSETSLGFGCLCLFPVGAAALRTEVGRPVFAPQISSKEIQAFPDSLLVSRTRVLPGPKQNLRQFLPECRETRIPVPPKQVSGLQV